MMMIQIIYHASHSFSRYIFKFYLNMNLTHCAIDHYIDIIMLIYYYINMVIDHTICQNSIGKSRE